LLDWGMVDEAGQRIRVLESGAVFRLYMTLRFQQAVSDLSCGFAIKDRRGTVLWGVTNIAYKLPPYPAVADETLTIASDGIMWLAAGDYFINLGAGHLEDGSKIDFIEDAIEFTVLGPGNIFTTSVVNLQAVFTMSSERQDPSIE
jgi:lipopolysaccharide transport system ATP-binding protein